MKRIRNFARQPLNQWWFGVLPVGLVCIMLTEGRYNVLDWWWYFALPTTFIGACVAQFKKGGG